MVDNNNPPDLQELLGKGGKKSFLVVPAIIILMLVWMSFYTVGPGRRGVLVRLGEVQPGVIEPGAHLKIPFVDALVELNVRVQKFSAKETAASKDLQVVATTIAVNYHLNPASVDKLYKTVGRSQAVQARILVPAVSNAVKAVTARYNAEELISKRDVVREGIEKEIREALKSYSVSIDAVSVTNFSFSREYTNAIEKKQVAQQRALQAKYELQKTKIDAQQRVVKAEAQAKATVAAAEAEAKAMRLKRQAITPELIKLEAIQRWDGKLPKVSSGDGGMMSLIDLKSVVN